MRPVIPWLTQVSLLAKYPPPPTGETALLARCRMDP
jgi:hypothetical protein